MNIITRQEWGARPARAVTPLPLAHVRRLFVHYTGSEADIQANHANCPGRVRAVQRFHLDTRGWADIAYSWIVCIHGAVFEGRGLGRRTAATGPCNDDSYAICFLGNDREGRRDVTPEALDAFAWLIADLERRKGGRLAVRGHRDCMRTGCPGDELYALIRSGNIRNPKEEDMRVESISNKALEEIARAVVKARIDPSPAFPADWNLTQHVRNEAIISREILAAVQGESVDEQAIVEGVLARLDPAAIADAVANAVGPELARSVADLLAQRLAA